MAGSIFRIKSQPNTQIAQAIGFNARGVYVDNVSAYWLFFKDANQYCPPFTMGWSAPLINTAGYAYMVPQTPYGQTNQANVTPGVSEFVETIWSEDAVAYSPGTPGATGSSVDPTIVDTASVSTILGASLNNQLAILNGTNDIVLIPAVAGQLIRLLQITLIYDIVGIPPFDFDSPVYVTVHTTNQLVNLQRVTLRIAGVANPVDTRYFSGGFEFPVGLPLQFDIFSYWAAQYYSIQATYQMV